MIRVAMSLSSKLKFDQNAVLNYEKREIEPGFVQATKKYVAYILI